MLIAIVFFTVFVIALMLYFGISAHANTRRKKTAERVANITSLAAAPTGEALGDLVKDQSLSSNPWLDDMLSRMDAIGQLQKLLIAADSKWTVPQFLGYSALAAGLGGGLTYLRTASLIPSLIVAAATAFIPMGILMRQRTARLRKFEQMLPDALDLMVSSIRAGHGLLSSMGMVAREGSAPISTEFRKCFDEQNFGMELRVALEHLAERVPVHDVQIVVTAILIQKECGGNLAEILEKVAQVIRERFRLKRQIRVHTAQGRLTGWILALLPVVLGFAIFLVNPTYMERLWTHPTGVKLMYVSAVMTLIGAWLIRKIVNVRI